MQRDVVTVEKFYTRHASSLQLKLAAGASGLRRIIREPTVNRPGLALAGFTKYFASKRVQVIGSAESTYLKSLPLLERGYSLVADDVTKVTLVDGREVMATSSELTRNHIEVRGIGIINVAAMFGVKSIRQEKRVDLIVTLKNWNEVPDVDRLGMEEQFVSVLGVNIPHITIPVRPGRDIPRLIEVAAFHTKLRLAGYNPAKELNDRLIAQMTKTPPL